MKAKRAPSWYDITAVDLEGRQYLGKYRVHDATHTGQIDVWCAAGSAAYVQVLAKHMTAVSHCFNPRPALIPGESTSTKTRCD